MAKDEHFERSNFFCLTKLNDPLTLSLELQYQLQEVGHIPMSSRVKFTVGNDETI